MITIYTTDRGLVTVESWDDVLELPSFTAKLNPQEHELSSIIGRYIFADKVHCGLSNCNTPHERGYIVATKSGPVTNIGKDCGAKYFGVDFEQLSKRFDRDIAEMNMRDALATFSFQIEGLESRVNELRDSAKWVNKHVHSLKTRGGNVPESVVHRLGEMVRLGSGKLTRPRPATESEIEALRASGTRINTPHYIDEAVGEIVGIQALYAEYDLRTLLVIQIDEYLKEFKTKNIDTLTYEELKTWSKWTGGIENIIDKVNQALKYGNALLTKANLSQFSQLLQRKESDTFHKFLRELP